MPRLFRKATSRSGTELVGYFQTALINRAISQEAKAAAEESEQATLNALTNYQAAHNGVFIAAGDIPTDSLENLSHRSLDAHLKKAQTGQIAAHTAVQLEQLQTEASQRYLRRRVRIIVTDRPAKPIEAIWFNARTGQSRISSASFRQIKGIIAEIDLDRNILLVRPSLAARTLVRGREYFLVYPISPTSLEPAISLSFT